MTMTDPLADMLTRIRNAQMRGKAKVVSPESNLRRRVLDVLQDEGYIRGYTRVEYLGGKSELEIELKYDNGQPVIREISRISKPGRRVYSSVSEIPRVRNGLGLAILSTPQGVISDAQARERNIGGEVLCKVF
ncbi:MAG: 30S ribosomal protein S8 [Alphaproteobacteria bacterium]